MSIIVIKYFVSNRHIMPNSTLRPDFEAKKIVCTNSFQMGSRIYIDKKSKFRIIFEPPASGHIHVVLEQQDPDLDFSIRNWGEFPCSYELFSKKYLISGTASKGRISTIEFKPSNALKWITINKPPLHYAKHKWILSEAMPGHYWLLILVIGGEWDPNKPAFPKTKVNEKVIPVYVVSNAIPIVLVNDLQNYLLVNIMLPLFVPILIFFIYLVVSPSERKLEELGKW